MRIFVEREGVTTDVTEAVRVVYDALHGSMDFGSGFLDSEEEVAMCDLARAAGFEAPEFGNDECHGCGHRRDRHGVAVGCWHTEWIREPEYERRMVTGEVATASLSAEAEERYRLRIEAANGVEEINRILEEARVEAERVGPVVATRQYETSVMVDEGEKRTCDCKEFR